MSAEATEASVNSTSHVGDVKVARMEMNVDRESVEISSSPLAADIEMEVTPASEDSNKENKEGPSCAAAGPLLRFFGKNAASSSSASSSSSSTDLSEGENRGILCDRPVVLNETHNVTIDVHEEIEQQVSRENGDVDEANKNA